MSTFQIRVQTATAHWVWTPNTSWVNEARFGFVRYNRPVESVDHNVPATQYGINTGVTNPVVGGMPNITVGGAQLGAFPQWPSLLGPDNNFDWLDQLSYSHGTHAFKFGGEVRHATIYSAGYSNGRGTFTFGGSQAFQRIVRHWRISWLAIQPGANLPLETRCETTATTPTPVLRRTTGASSRG